MFRYLSVFLKILKSQGFKVAMAKSKQKMAKKFFNDNDTKLVGDDAYLLHQNSQRDYISKHLSQGLTTDNSQIIYEAITHNNIDLNDLDSITIMPLAYPLDLKQRPDHILQCLSDNKNISILLAIDDKAPYFEKIGDNKYLTNILVGTISFFQKKRVVFYITYPFFRYILQFLPQAICLYDVLDDLSVFSLNCEEMLKDHKELLNSADIVIFSSEELKKANIDMVNNSTYLIKNGVWSQDFIVKDIEKNKQSGTYTIGYHGAISELINWSLLKEIVDIPNVKLILIGPIIAFDQWSKENILLRDYVLNAQNVEHLGTKPYEELKIYLSQFDAGIIPFEINQKTDYVLPLKLFEYMASGLDIYATATKTLTEYKEDIFIGNTAQIKNDIINKIKQNNFHFVRNYNHLLEKVDWAKQMAPVVEHLKNIRAQKKESGKQRNRKIDIVNINFFDWDGEVLYKGGAERYVYDLACLIKEQGDEVRIIQNANKEFKINFKGILVQGIKTNSGGDLRLMSKKYAQVCQDSDLVIASPLDLACELKGLNVIGINHGIYWDHKYKKLSNFCIKEYNGIFDSLKVACSVIAVDTNFINWVRTFDYSISKKIEYIPNYFDAEFFTPKEKCFTGKIRVLYPRRLYEARGIFITLNAFEYLFTYYDNVELYLVGQANEEDTEIINQFVLKHPGKVVWEEFDMEDMHKVYATSHIALVPTLYSEGTSLSCIEAMATNNAIISTNIGGLPNLIIDSYNGLLINPTSYNLSAAIESLLLDRTFMEEIASNALNMSKVFNKKIWLKKWLDAFQSKLN